MVLFDQQTDFHFTILWKKEIGFGGDEVKFEPALGLKMLF
jgi:hypothetical protein